MKRCTLLWVGLFAALASLTGCISGPDLKGQPFFTSPAEPRADEATVYFYRTSASIGSGVAPTIEVDGRAIGSLPSGSFFKAGIPAGKHSVTSTSPPIISGMVNQRFDITVENGKVYYIADQLSTSDYTDGQTLGEVDGRRFSGTMFYSRYALVPGEEALRSIKWCQELPAPAP